MLVHSREPRPANHFPEPVFLRDRIAPEPFCKRDPDTVWDPGDQPYPEGGYGDGDERKGKDNVSISPHGLAAAGEDVPVPYRLSPDLEYFVSCNPAFERLYGYQESEIIGRNLDDLITTEATKSEAVAYTTQAGDRAVYGNMG